MIVQEAVSGTLGHSSFHLEAIKTLLYVGVEYPLLFEAMVNSLLLDENKKHSERSSRINFFSRCQVWCNQEPRLSRYRCESFVLSLRFDEADLFCGLNNGSIQLWDLNFNIQKREQEFHDKGVKVAKTLKPLVENFIFGCCKNAKWHCCNEWKCICEVAKYSKGLSKASFL